MNESSGCFTVFIIFLIILLYPSQPEYKVADPICTFLFSVVVLGTTLPVTKDVFRILMEGKNTLPLCACHGLIASSWWLWGPCLFSAGTPQDVHVDAVRELLLSVGGVVDVHSLHMWSLNMTHSLLSVHVAAGTGKVPTGNLTTHRFICPITRDLKIHQFVKSTTSCFFLLNLAFSLSVIWPG